MSQCLVKSLVPFPNEPEPPPPEDAEGVDEIVGLAFAGCYPDPLYCNNCGKCIDPGPEASYWLVRDIGDPPLDPDLPEGTVGDGYVPDEWYGCCEACADAIIAHETLPEELPGEDRETDQGRTS